MNIEYIYCNSCGYESFNEFCSYSRQTANGDWYLCPCCKQETINLEDDEE